MSGVSNLFYRVTKIQSIHSSTAATMSLSPQTVLVTLLETYDDTGDPLSTETLAEQCGHTPSDITPILRSLCQIEFVTEADGNYRPTVTAREFQQYNIELEDIVAVDIVDE